MVNKARQDSEASKMDKLIESKILHVLSLFPIISPSMLQMSLGTGIPASHWKPILEALIEAGEVYRYERLSVSPGGRAQAVTCISCDPDPNPSEAHD